jgi:hypothetical protein
MREHLEIDGLVSSTEKNLRDGKSSTLLLQTSGPLEASQLYILLAFQSCAKSGVRSNCYIKVRGQSPGSDPIKVRGQIQLLNIFGLRYLNSELNGVYGRQGAMMCPYDKYVGKLLGGVTTQHYFGSYCFNFSSKAWAFCSVAWHDALSR